jgi:hypothetical protein
MISLKCPHCRVALKVDEKKIPEGIVSFPCPKCKRDIPVSYLDSIASSTSEAGGTLVVFRNGASSGAGGETKSARLTVLPNAETPLQEFILGEGILTVGREAKVSTASICIHTSDKLMSRSHIMLETRKNPKSGGYFYCLSDNNSKNNTLYNGKRLDSGDVMVLKDNDEITLGNTTLRFNE